MKIEISDAMVGRLLKGLQDFGYPELTFDETRKAVDDALAGVEREDVIGILVKRQIDEATAAAF